MLDYGSIINIKYPYQISYSTTFGFQPLGYISPKITKTWIISGHLHLYIKVKIGTYINAVVLWFVSSLDLSISRDFVNFAFLASKESRSRVSKVRGKRAFFGMKKLKVYNLKKYVWNLFPFEYFWSTKYYHPKNPKKLQFVWIIRMKKNPKFYF